MHLSYMSVNFRCDADNIFTHFSLTMFYLDIDKFWWWQSRKSASLPACWVEARMRAVGSSWASSACRSPLTHLSQCCLHLSGLRMGQKCGGTSAPSVGNHSSRQKVRREQHPGLVDFHSSTPCAASSLPSVCLLCLSGMLRVHVGKWKVP